MPAVKSHPIQSMADLDKVGNPNPLTDGIFPQTYEKIRYFRENMPADFGCRLAICRAVEHCTSTGGEKIFLDVYDNPELSACCLILVTDFMIKAIPMMKEAIGEEWEVFYLQGTKNSGGFKAVQLFDGHD